MNEGGVGPEENSQSNDIIPSSSSVSLSKKVEIVSNFVSGFTNLKVLIF